MIKIKFMLDLILLAQFHVGIPVYNQHLQHRCVGTHQCPKHKVKACTPALYTATLIHHHCNEKTEGDISVCFFSFKTQCKCVFVGETLWRGHGGVWRRDTVKSIIFSNFVSVHHYIINKTIKTSLKCRLSSLIQSTVLTVTIQELQFLQRHIFRGSNKLT